MLLLDKYRPSNVQDSMFHHNLLELLKEMSKDDAIPHILFYGNNGSGKKTLIKLFMTMLFDKSINNVKDTPYVVTSSGNKKTTELIKQSCYHIEIDPKNTNYDRYLIREIVKEYAETKQMSIHTVKRNFKIILINNIDNLSYYAQVSLRRTIEKHSDTCRFIIWSRSLTKIIKPLQSRCVCIRVPCPTNNELFLYASRISCIERIDLTLGDLVTMMLNAKGNIKNIVFALEYKKHNCDKKSKYFESIKNIVNLILTAKLTNIMRIRHELYNLQITNIDKATIIKDMTTLLCDSNKIDSNKKYKIINKIANHEPYLNDGRRDVIHYDAIVIGIIKILLSG